MTPRLVCLYMPADDDEDEEDGNDDEESPGKAGKGKRRTSDAAGKGKGKSLTASAKAALASSKKPPISKFAALRHSTYKALFGWLDPKFKRNGKKLLASNNVLWRFMVRDAGNPPANLGCRLLCDVSLLKAVPAFLNSSSHSPTSTCRSTCLS